MAKQYYTCHTCNNQFVSYSPKKFCGIDCYRVFQKTPEYKTNFTEVRTKHRTSCTNCGTEVLGRKSTKRNGEKADNKFCNRKCYDEYRTKLQQQVVGQCQNCGNNLLLGKHQKNAKFCCIECRLMSKRPKPTHCVNCGVWFTTIKIHKKKGGGVRLSGCSSTKTCSNECLNEFYRTNEARKEKISQAFMGSKHPNWQGGASHTKVDYRGSNWQRLRKQVMKRDNYTCCHCGITQKEQLARYGRDFSVNHIIPFHQYGNTVIANKLSNLETLCDSCHTKADWKYRKENPIQGVLNFGRSG
ncbi:HNH endonuclease [Faucicola boevrei]|uniref:HNH endonuclease n=1 Tax=Faucicola boevrei TaxID=346665 RepID=UPI00037A8D0B|nr:HNH endonuclease [Moraxella boevrei]